MIFNFLEQGRFQLAVSICKQNKGSTYTFTHGDFGWSYLGGQRYKYVYCCYHFGGGKTKVNPDTIRYDKEIKKDV